VSIALGRAFGYAADHVHEIDVVTADGELRHVTPDCDPDLFFALLGGKSNFGVVTALEFSLFPVTELYAGSLQFPGENAREALEAYRSLAARATDALTSSIVFLRAPDLPFIPEPMRGKLSIFVRLSYLGPAADGEEMITPLRAAAPVLADTVTTMPAAQVASITDDPADPGTFVEHFAMLDELSPSAVEAILEAAHEELGLELISWLAPPGGRKHPGYLSPADASVERTRLAYDEATYERLRTVKTKYDPQNMFRWNHNIPPRA
jgi:FAD/FMN-containing dehydrogenase